MHIHSCYDKNNMKKLLFFLLPAVVLLGQGCPINPNSNQVPPGTPTNPSQPQVQSTGCTPKALTVVEPQPGSTQTLPLQVSVIVDNGSQPNCTWTVFEAQAGIIQLLDSAGIAVGSGTLTTTQDWMTDDPVGYAGEIPAIAIVPPGPATLVITEEDPSGMGDSQTIEIPIIIQ